ncbi:hypothetical protein N0V82_003866 [Gnomoniopsis sp. IMI 355080]|nr:hypothetical protein N0V82_003866 [Gnomoniopsis sp. IMI 355080]
MPEKSLTVAAYAAGASLAAATLIYVFAPTFFLDSEVSGSSSFLSGSSRKKGVVGLVNPANDCFINSILQALAGLGDLRLYLIREMHRRNIDEDWVYLEAVPEDWKGDGVKRTSPLKRDLVAGQQRGLVTLGLKEMLDQLNKRPLHKKTISAAPFVEVLERAFKQNISRQQHDAQEFLQVVVERLCDEYHAGHRARKYARSKASSHGSSNCRSPSTNGDIAHEDLTALPTEHEGDDSTTKGQPAIAIGIPDDEDEEGFPMEGKTESQVECMNCGFKPRPMESRFCTLTLSVPQNSTSTTLNACFDGLFKTEYIDDYMCDRCRLVHAHEVYSIELTKATSEATKARIQKALAKLQHSIETDPEKPPKDVELPDSKQAPRRRIARHTRVTRFPKILAIHLQRSIYAGQALKNSAKVAFPEKLPLGGLLLRRNYKLLGVVAHKGGHDTGHYESFRRQNVYPPFSNPSTFQASGVYSKTATPLSTPQLQAQAKGGEDSTPMSATPDLSSPASTSTPSLESTIPPERKGSMRLNGNGPSFSNTGPTSAPRETTTGKDGKERKDSDSNSLRSIAVSAKSTISKISPSRRSGSGSGGSRTATPVPNGNASKPHKKRRTQERWWRISDEKIKEASTRELLGMQREVYLLFYEMERDGP